MAPILEIDGLTKRFGGVAAVNRVSLSLESGRPLVAADAVGPAAYVDDGVNGLLVPKNDAAALAEAIRRVIHEPDLAGRLVAGGRASYEAQFTRAAFVRDSLALYGRIVASVPPASR